MKDKNGNEISPGQWARIGRNVAMLVSGNRFLILPADALEEHACEDVEVANEENLKGPEKIAAPPFVPPKDPELTPPVVTDPATVAPATVIHSLIILLACLLLGTGCSTGKSNFLDRTFYNVTTNQVPEVSLSPGGQAGTNLVPVIQLEDRPAALTAVQTGGGILGGMFGAGPLATLAAGGLYHIYQQLRNRKIHAALIQGIETAKSVIASTAQGQSLSQSFQAALIKQQSAAGVLSSVSALVKQFT